MLLINNYITMFIWSNEIDQIEWNVVTFKDWTTKTYNSKELEYLKSEEPRDLTQLRDSLIKSIIPEIMQLIEDYNVKKWDLQVIIQAIIESYNYNFYTAIWKAFWTYDEVKHPSYFQENIDFNTIKKFIS